MAEFKASHRYAPVTARKARLVADLVRGLPVNRALIVLDRAPQRAAQMLGKVVRSAVANAENMAEIDPNHLHLAVCRVDEGPMKGGYKRWRPAARGRAMPYRKRTSHMHVTLATAVSENSGVVDNTSPASAGSATTISDDQPVAAKDD